MVTPELRRRAVVHLQCRFGVSERRACAVVGQARSTQRKPPAVPDDEEQRLRAWLRAFSARHPRWGWRRAATCAAKAGFSANRKRVQRLWRDEGLKVPYKRKKKAPLGIGVQVGAFCPIRPNVVWGRIQVVAATSSLNRSAGVSHARVLRGRSFNSEAMSSRSAWEYTDKSVPLGRN
jgi:hypothetical protein